jgi:adenylate cyclase class 2
VPRTPRRLQRDVLLDRPSRDLVGRGCALRVRDDGAGAVLTYKGPVTPGPHKVREEIETRAESADRLIAILAAAGFEPVFRYEKYREELTVPGAIVAIDETPIGTYVEIEGSAEAIDALAAALGRTPGDYITTSYRALYVAAVGEDAAGDMTFASRR